MNIGIVTVWFERGAGYVSKQFRDVLSTRHNVFIYVRAGERTRGKDHRWNTENVRWSKPVPGMFESSNIDKKDFYRWIQKNNIEIVIFNEQRWWYPLLWCKEWGIKTIAYVDYYTEQTIPLFKVYDCLICNTRKHFQAFSWHPGARYVPWGTDIELFKPHSENRQDRLSHVCFFHSSGMSPVRKGTDLLLKAFDKVRVISQLIIHTQVDLKVALPDLRSLIEKLESENRLTVIHKTVSAPGLYYLGDVYVYPSRLDGIGLTVVEAISSGLPCIVPDNSPMNEFVNEEIGKTVKISHYYSRSDGYYWPACEASVDSLAEIMEFYTNKKVVAEQSIKARDYAIKNYDWTTNSKGLLEIVSDLSAVNNICNIQNIAKEIAHYENTSVRKLNSIVLKTYKYMPFFNWLIKKLK